MKAQSERNRLRGLTLAAFLVATGTQGLFADSESWKQVRDVEEAGWSKARLLEAKRIAEEVGSTSVMAVQSGGVVAAWGQIDRPLPLFSMRKGLYNALCGIAVAEGKIKLDARLADLDVDDLDGLTESERSATIEDLLTARSGIYHASAYEPAAMKRSRPDRGSQSPGAVWFYNNWDFNVLATLVAGTAGSTVGEMFRERIARPLGMEDFSLENTFSFFEPSRSRFPAQLFEISARDLARFGELYRLEGQWKGKQILAPEWIRRSWTLHAITDRSTQFGTGNGFGYLWWVYPGHDDATSPLSSHAVYTTQGMGGQVLAVIPSLDLVVVHQVDGVSVGFDEAIRVIDAIVSAIEGESARKAETAMMELRPEPLPGAKPIRPTREIIPWTREIIDALVGDYRINPRMTVQIHEVKNRLFLLPKGAPLAEIEIFAETPDRFFASVAPIELSLRAERDADGNVAKLTGRIQGRPAEALRIDVESQQP